MPTDDHNNIPTECLGVSGAVNFLKPDKQELLQTQQLELAIKNLNIFESVEETRQRREALIELQDFCNIWIYKKAIDYMYPEIIAKAIKGKIFTFGSYRLGVNFSGADIDALLVGPKFISRDEFFDDFVAFLSENPSAKEIHAVPKAFVPVLKMKFCNVEIDLLFASVDQMSIPHDFCLSENSDQLLRNMDERDVRSVNGVRVTDDILRLVFDKKTFKSALKIIRIWAKRRCIYSNAMGFCGGVSWAILVARVCQLWPLASVSTIVNNFFKFYGTKWRWPSPVVLKEVEESSVLHLMQWDPRVNPSDQNHVMPILTPSYPSQNSTYNVCESHKRFMIDQMQKAFKVLQQITLKEKTFQDLFKPLFFFSYRHYLVVTFRCVDRKQFREDSSLIESKLRLLVQYVESNTFVDFALLYLRSFDRIESLPNSILPDDKSFVRRWFVGMELKKVEKSLYLVEEINRFKNVVKVDVDVSYSRRLHLAAFLPQEEVDKIREKMQAVNLRKRNSESGSAATPIDSVLSCSEIVNKPKPEETNLRKRNSAPNMMISDEEKIELKRRKLNEENSQEQNDSCVVVPAEQEQGQGDGEGEVGTEESVAQDNGSVLESQKNNSADTQNNPESDNATSNNDTVLIPEFVNKPKPDEANQRNSAPNMMMTMTMINDEEKTEIKPKPSEDNSEEQHNSCVDVPTAQEEEVATTDELVQDKESVTTIQQTNSEGDSAVATIDNVLNPEVNNSKQEETNLRKSYSTATKLSSDEDSIELKLRNLNEVSSQQQNSIVTSGGAITESVDYDVSSSSTIVAKCSSTAEDRLHLSGGISTVSSTTEKDTIELVSVGVSVHESN